MSNKKKPKINAIDYENKDKEYINTKGYVFKIVDKNTKVKITKNGNKKWITKYLIRFVDTGYEKWVDTKELNNGSIKDEKAPYVCGVGIVGTEIDHPQSHYLYDRWRDMIRRCYDKNCSSYASYGACGVIVCDEWLYFPNYVRDIEGKENHEKLKERHINPMNRYEIDKDIIKKDNKIYCNEYCSIVTHKENLDERNERNNYNKASSQKAIWRISLDFKEIKKYDSISDAGIDICGRKSTAIFGCVCGRQISALGYYWKRVCDFNTPESAIDDIKFKLSEAKDNPKARRKNDYVLLNLDDEVVKEFNNVTGYEMADILKISRNHFSRCVNGGTKYRNTYKIRKKKDIQHEQ